MISNGVREGILLLQAKPKKNPKKTFLPMIGLIFCHKFKWSKRLYNFRPVRFWGFVLKMGLGQRNPQGTSFPKHGVRHQRCRRAGRLQCGSAVRKYAAVYCPDTGATLLNGTLNVSFAGFCEASLPSFASSWRNWRNDVFHRSTFEFFFIREKKCPQYL